MEQQWEEWYLLYAAPLPVLPELQRVAKMQCHHKSPRPTACQCSRQMSQQLLHSISCTGRGRGEAHLSERQEQELAFIRPADKILKDTESAAGT